MPFRHSLKECVYINISRTICGALFENNLGGKWNQTILCILLNFHYFNTFPFEILYSRNKFYINEKNNPSEPHR